MAHMSVPANDGNTGTNGALTRHLITQQVDGFLCFASDASSSASLPSGIYHLPSTITAPRAKRPNPISTALGPSRWSTRRMHQRMYLGTTTIMEFFLSLSSPECRVVAVLALRYLLTPPIPRPKRPERSRRIRRMLVGSYRLRTTYIDRTHFY